MAYQKTTKHEEEGKKGIELVNEQVGSAALICKGVVMFEKNKIDRQRANAGEGRNDGVVFFQIAVLSSTKITVKPHLQQHSFAICCSFLFYQRQQLHKL